MVDPKDGPETATDEAVEEVQGAVIEEIAVEAPVAEVVLENEVTEVEEVPEEAPEAEEAVAPEPEEEASDEPEAEEEAQPKKRKRRRGKKKEKTEPEAPAEAPDNEPDEPSDTGPQETTDPNPPQEEEEEEAPQDFPAGVVTPESDFVKFEKLRRVWVASGKPRRITALGTQWMAVDDGTKFADQGAAGSMGDYGSLSTSRIRK